MIAKCCDILWDWILGGYVECCAVFNIGLILLVVIADVEGDVESSFVDYLKIRVW